MCRNLPDFEFLVWGLLTKLYSGNMYVGERACGCARDTLSAFFFEDKLFVSSVWTSIKIRHAILPFPWLPFAKCFVNIVAKTTFYEYLLWFSLTPLPRLPVQSDFLRFICSDLIRCHFIVLAERIGELTFWC